MNTTPRVRVSLALTGLALAASTLAGCSGSTGPSSPSASPTSTGQPSAGGDGWAVVTDGAVKPSCKADVDRWVLTVTVKNTAKDRREMALVATAVDAAKAPAGEFRWRGTLEPGKTHAVKAARFGTVDAKGRCTVTVLARPATS